MTVEVVQYQKPWLLFWLAITFALLYIVISFIRKWSLWSSGISEEPERPGSIRRAAVIWIAEVFLQRQLLALSFSRWLIHLLIFYGFMGLLLLSAVVIGLKLSGLLVLTGSLARFYLNPAGYIVVKLWGDFFGLLLLTGLVLASIRRFVLRPAQQINAQADLMLLVFLLLAVFSGFALEGLRLAVVAPDVARFSFVGKLFTPPGKYVLDELRPWLTACWSFHAFIVISFLCYLPHSKLMHSILAPIVIFLNAKEEYGREDVYWPKIADYKRGK